MGLCLAAAVWLSSVAASPIAWAGAQGGSAELGRAGQSSPAGAPTSSAEAVLAALHDEGDWQLLRHDSRSGVDIYRKDVAGMALPAFRAEKDVAASSERLFELILDLNRHAGLSDTIPLIRSQVLSRRGDELDYMQYLDSPGWTLARDRYWFNRARVQRDLAGRVGHHRLSWQGIDPAGYPRQWRALLAGNEDAIRTPINYGSWEVIPQAGGRSRLVYRVLSDPGGSLPRSAQLLVTARTLPENLLQFESEVLRSSARAED